MAYPQAAKEVSLLLLIEKDEELYKVMTELAEGQFQPEAWNQTRRGFLQKTQLLLGHKSPNQTARYHDDQGKDWTTLAV